MPPGLPAEQTVIRVAVLEDTHPQTHVAPPKVHLVRPAAAHVTAPVVPQSAPPAVPPVAATDVAGGASIRQPSRKSRSGNVMLNYPAMVSLALARVKTYPLSERIAHHQGRVWLYLEIAASGELMCAKLQHSSGVASLDRVALSMAAHAAPFSPVPGGRAIRLAVPVTFSLGA